MIELPLVSLITINYNGLDYTTELLDSIRTFQYSPLEIFVVDNASIDNPQVFLSQEYPEVKFIRSEKNLGFAGGNNLALPYATGKYLFFINNDAEFTESCLQKLVTFMEIHPDAGVVSPLLCYFNESKKGSNDLIQYAGMTQVSTLTARNKTIGEKELDTHQFKIAKKTAYSHGAAMLVRRTVLKDVGTMYDKFFLYYEELDWCERMRKAGLNCYVEPNARIYHKESAAVGASSPLKTYFLNRNRILFMRRNNDALKLIPFFLFIIFIAIPKNIYTFFVRGEFKLMRAFLEAFKWNVVDMRQKIFSKNNYHQPPDYIFKNTKPKANNFQINTSKF